MCKLCANNINFVELLFIKIMYEKVNNGIVVITGVLKDYLRELPEPLLTKCLYQMLVDALGVCLPDDPEGNARLLFSIIECLPKPNRVSLICCSLLVTFYR